MPLAGGDPLGIYSRWAAEYGGIFHYRFLWNHIYFLSDPDYIDYVLVRNASNFIKDRTTRNSRWLLGDGLVLSEGEHWMRQRRLIQPAFHRDRIAGYAAIMTSYTRDMVADWRNGSAIDIHREMMQAYPARRDPVAIRNGNRRDADHFALYESGDERVTPASAS